MLMLRDMWNWILSESIKLSYKSIYNTCVKYLGNELMEKYTELLFIRVMYNVNQQWLMINEKG